MKYVLSILCLFMLGACNEINTSNNTVAGADADATSGITCGDLDDINWPDKKLADNNPDDPYILVYSIGENSDPIKTRLKPFESDIRQYPDLNVAYDKMIENTTRHYIDFLHMSPDVAARYAPITVLSSLYNFVLY